MINLLPSEEKKELKEIKFFSFIVIVEILIIIFLLILSLMLFLIKSYIVAEVRSQEFLINKEQESLNSAKFGEVEKNIKGINQEFSQLNFFYENQKDLTPLFETITRFVPAGIYITSLSYLKDSSEIVLQGSAKKREDILKFKKSLEDNGQFENFYSPISNLVKPENINFFFKFNISKNK